MKKLLGLIVAVSVLAASSMSAFAELKTEPVVDDFGVETGAYTTYSTAQEAGANAMVTLLVVNGDLSNVDVNTIQYIDQSVADANGDFTFTSYIPKEAPGTGVTYNVYVGGTNFTSAQPGGTISRLENPSTFIFSGTVTKLGSLTPATVKLTNLATQEVITAEADAASGAFSVEVPAGEYSVAVSKIAHMTRNTAKVDLTSAAFMKDFVLRAGDVDNSESINIDDILAIINSYGTYSTDTAYQTIRDVDESNSINIDDILATINNYGLYGSSFND